MFRLSSKLISFTNRPSTDQISFDSHTSRTRHIILPRTTTLILFLLYIPPASLPPMLLILPYTSLLFFPLLLINPSRISSFSITFLSPLCSPYASLLLPLVYVSSGILFPFCRLLSILLFLTHYLSISLYCFILFSSTHHLFM